MPPRLISPQPRLIEPGCAFLKHSTRQLSGPVFGNLNDYAAGSAGVVVALPQSAGMRSQRAHFAIAWIK